MRNTGAWLIQIATRTAHSTSYIFLIIAKYRTRRVKFSTDWFRDCFRTFVQLLQDIRITPRVNHTTNCSRYLVWESSSGLSSVLNQSIHSGETGVKPDSVVCLGSPCRIGYLSIYLSTFIQVDRVLYSRVPIKRATFHACTPVDGHS